MFWDWSVWLNGVPRAPGVCRDSFGPSLGDLQLLVLVSSFVLCEREGFFHAFAKKDFGLLGFSSPRMWHKRRERGRESGATYANATWRSRTQRRKGIWGPGGVKPSWTRLSDRESEASGPGGIANTTWVTRTRRRTLGQWIFGLRDHEGTSAITKRKGLGRLQFISGFGSFLTFLSCLGDFWRASRENFHHLLQGNNSHIL